MWNLRLTSFRAGGKSLNIFASSLRPVQELSGVHGYLAHDRHCLLPATDCSNPETCSWTRRSNENAPAPLTTTTKASAIASRWHSIPCPSWFPNHGHLAHRRVPVRPALLVHLS